MCLSVWEICRFYLPCTFCYVCMLSAVLFCASAEILLAFFVFIGIFGPSKARMTPACTICRRKAPCFTVWCCSRFFIAQNALRRLEYFRKVDTRMKRRTHAHPRRRSSRPAVMKQQILIREARKQAKYPMRTLYHYPVILHRSRNRGA